MYLSGLFIQTDLQVTRNRSEGSLCDLLCEYDSAANVQTRHHAILISNISRQWVTWQGMTDRC